MSAADVGVGGWNAGKRHKGSSCASVIDKSLLVLRPPFAHTGCYELMIRSDVKTGNDFDLPKHPLQYLHLTRKYRKHQ